MTLGERIAALRKERKMSQEQLGNVTGLGASHISRLEAGHYPPNISTLERIAEGLHGVLFIDIQLVPPEHEREMDGYWIGRAQKQLRP